jgi:hypothetical protein
VFTWDMWVWPTAADSGHLPLRINQKEAQEGTASQLNEIEEEVDYGVITLGDEEDTQVADASPAPNGQANPAKKRPRSPIQRSQRKVRRILSNFDAEGSG